MKWLKTNWTMRKTSSVQTIHSSMVTRSSRSTREWRGLVEYWLERQLSCLPLSNLASNLVAYYDSLDHRQKIVRTNPECAKIRDNLSVWEEKNKEEQPGGVSASGSLWSSTSSSTSSSSSFSSSTSSASSFSSSWFSLLHFNQSCRLQSRLHTWVWECNVCGVFVIEKQSKSV